MLCLLVHADSGVHQGLQPGQAGVVQEAALGGEVGLEYRHTPSRYNGSSYYRMAGKFGRNSIWRIGSKKLWIVFGGLKFSGFGYLQSENDIILTA